MSEARSTGVTRASFTRLAAGAIVAAPVAASAAEPPASASSTHTPMVGEKDPRIVVDTSVIDYLDETTNAHRKIGAYAAHPKTMTSATPGVVVIQAIWGVDAQLRDIVRRLAAEGYYAIAPDLYTGLGAPSGDGATDFRPFREISKQLVNEQVDRDLRGAATTIRVRADKLTHGNSNDKALLARKVGAIGFCMGGGIALRQAVDNGDVFQSVAVFYGKVRYSTDGDDKGPITPIALAYAPDVVSPLLGSFGATDTSISPDDVRALDARLTSANRPHDIKIYDGAGHAFFDDSRPSYDASAAADAWTRTLNWFRTTLA